MRTIKWNKKARMVLCLNNYSIEMIEKSIKGIEQLLDRMENKLYPPDISILYENLIRVYTDLGYGLKELKICFEEESNEQT